MRKYRVNVGHHPTERQAYIDARRDIRDAVLRDHLARVALAKTELARKEAIERLNNSFGSSVDNS